MNATCPMCRKPIEIDPVEEVEAVRHIPARLVYVCPYCHTRFYRVKDAEDQG